MNLLVASLAAIAAYLIAANLARPPARRSRPRRVERVSATRARLDHAGVRITVGRYRATIATGAAITALVFYASTSTASLAVPPILLCLLAPRLYFQRREARTLAAQRAAWPEAIRDVLAHLAAGQSVNRALCQLGRTGPEPLRDLWQRYEHNAALIDATAALELARAEIADPVADRVIEAFIAAHDHGRDVIIGVLRSLADNVTRDLQMLEQITTGQTEMRSQAVIAVVLPFAVLAFLVSANDGYRSFYRTGAGWFVVLLGLVLAAGGWKLIVLLGRIPTEHRILTTTTSAHRPVDGGGR